MLSSLDTVSSPISTITAGPFAIFQTEGYSRDTRLTDEDKAVNAPLESLANPVDSDEDQPQVDLLSSTSPAQLDHSHCFDSDISQVFWEIQENSSESLSMVTLLAEIDDALVNDEPFTSRVPWLTPLLPSSPRLELSMPLFNDHDTSMLMYHYMNHVSELLQPVLHPQNPWRTTYFRFALEGCTDAVSGQTSLSLSTSKVSTAIFHGVLSSAAFHLRNATIDSNKYHKLGLQHRTKALQALHAALALPQDTQLYTVYLTAMLSLVTIDVRPLSRIP